MGLNTLEFAQALRTKLDERMVEQSTTGWMEANAGQVIYDGGKKNNLLTLQEKLKKLK